MAYFTGTAANISAFAQAIVSAAASVGWSIDKNDAGNGEYAFHNSDGNYWSIREPRGYNSDNGATPNSYPYLNVGCGLYTYTNSAYDSSRSAYNQPPRAASGPVPARGEWFNLANSVGPYVKHHIFADTHYIHCVLEVRAKYFFHLMFGQLDKKGGVYTGGQYTQKSWCDSANLELNNVGIGYNTVIPPFSNNYFDGAAAAGVVNTSSNFGTRTGPQNHLMVSDVENAGRWAYPGAYKIPGTSEADLYGFVGLGHGFLSQHMDQHLCYGSANELTGATIVIPNRIWLQAAQDRCYFLGEVPDFGIVDMSFLAPGQSIFYGTDEWMIFPVFKQDLTDKTAAKSSYSVGYAYKVNR